MLLKHDLKAVLGHPLRAVGRGQDPSLVDERAAAEVVVLVRVSERGLQAGNPGELVRGGVVSADYVWPNLSSIFRVVAKVKPTSAAYAFQDVCQVLVWFSHVGWFFSFRRWFVGIVHIGVEVNGRPGQRDTADYNRVRVEKVRIMRTKVDNSTTLPKKSRNVHPIKVTSDEI